MIKIYIYSRNSFTCALQIAYVEGTMIIALIIILGCTLFQKDYDVLSLCDLLYETMGPQMKVFPYFVFEANRLV
ncbi:hypothetical protein BpHYR1_038174 [Brachionus plicatilis]|uniref:Uncharacterized protein n=1 Tax=Brachionus plicatilis TaxID=10195 RepID=A0A3M7PXY5_BRAPC|nr:hypothetical protein BpHYR1_038174 [Brachionus plicatilis]